MQQSRSPVPVRPHYPSRSARHLERAGFAAVRAAIGGTTSRNPAAAARSLFGDDGEVPAFLLQRAAVAGAKTDTPTWAQELAQHAVADFLAGLGPSSAASELAARSVIIPLANDYAELRVPYAPTVPVGGYVGEGLPIPSAAAPLSTAVLSPAKAGIGLVLSRELAQVGGETVFRLLLTESAALTLDALVFDITAPGLLAGLTPLASVAPLADLGALAEAVSGSGTCVFVAGTSAAAHLGLRADHKAVVFPSGGIPGNRLIACDPRAIIFAALPEPEIAASAEALWHMSDTPEQIGTPGTPPVVAAPTISAFQSGNIILRLLLTLAFAARSATAVAYIDTAWVAP